MSTWLEILNDALTAIKAITDALPDAGALTTMQADLDNPNQYKADLSTLETRLSTLRAGYLDQLDFDLQEAIAALPTPMVGTNNAATVADGWDAALATILDNFSAGRIGNLDQLDFNLQELLNTIAGYLDAEIDIIITSQGRMLLTLDFWSLPQEEVAVVQAAGDKSLPSVTVADLPAGATIVRAIAMFKFRMVEAHTYAGVNSLDGAQQIQVATSVNAINFVTGQFTLAQDTREGGDVVMGLIDISGTVTANGAYAFHWDLAKALQDGIKFNDIQVGLRLWYSV